MSECMICKMNMIVGNIFTENRMKVFLVLEKQNIDKT